VREITVEMIDGERQNKDRIEREKTREKDFAEVSERADPKNGCN
jgi:hypothetical protein